MPTKEITNQPSSDHYRVVSHEEAAAIDAAAGIVTQELRLPEHDLRDLKTIAELDEVPLNGLINRVLKAYVVQRQSELLYEELERHRAEKNDS